jgi:hypothetical protein
MLITSVFDSPLEGQGQTAARAGSQGDEQLGLNQLQFHQQDGRDEFHQIHAREDRRLRQERHGCVGCVLYTSRWCFEFRGATEITLNAKVSRGLARPVDLFPDARPLQQSPPCARARSVRRSREEFLNDREIIVAANTSGTSRTEVDVIVEQQLRTPGDTYAVLYSNKAAPPAPNPVLQPAGAAASVQEVDGSAGTGPLHSIRVALDPMEVKILGK